MGERSCLNRNEVMSQPTEMLTNISGLGHVLEIFENVGDGSCVLLGMDLGYCCMSISTSPIVKW